MAGFILEGKKGSEHVHPEDLGYAKLFEVVRNGVVVVDARAQRIVLWNSAATGIFGYSPSKALNEGPLRRDQQASWPDGGSQDSEGNMSSTVLKSRSARA